MTDCWIGEENFVSLKENRLFAFVFWLFSMETFSISGFDFKHIW